MSVGISTEGRFGGSIGWFRSDHRAKPSSCRSGRDSRGCGRSSSVPVRAGRGYCKVCGTQRTCAAHRGGSQRGSLERFVEWSRERAFARGRMGLWVSLYSPYMHSWVGVWILELPNGIFCEHVFLGHPLVLRIRIALPFDEILQLVPLSEMP
jgi:hypothetical protein